jgi:hypothetical protein
MPVDPSMSFYLHVSKNHHCGRLGPSSPGGVALRCVSFCFSCPVESRCGAVVLGSAYRVPALSVAGASLASPWLRFHIPLIKPGGPFSGTRLSDKALLHLLLHTFAHEQSPLGPSELV